MSSRPLTPARLRGITAKALIVGALAVLTTSAVLTLFASAGINDLGTEASTEIDRQVRDQIETFNRGSHGLVSGQAEAVQERVDSSLVVATDVLDRTGSVGLGSEMVDWTATNQFSKESLDIALPRFEVGGQWLGQNTSISTYSPVVDDITELIGGTTTIFQRMNEAGDMLRVSTNVETLENKRAVGTFIPASNPDGTPNGVISAVLAGETFRGTAYVVNAWYVTAYQPIFDDGGEVVGILYVGVRQDEAGGLVDKVSGSQLGENGASFVLGSKGSRAGTFEIAPPGINPATPTSDVLDDSGRSHLDELAEQAVAAGGEQVEIEYRSDGEDHIAVASYFEPWDWIIVTDVTVSDFAAASQKIDAYGQELVSRLVLVGVIAAVVIAGLAMAYLRRSVARPIERATSQMLESVEAIQRLSHDLGRSSVEGADRLDEVLSNASQVVAHSQSQSDLVRILTSALDETLGQTTRSRAVGTEAAERVQDGFDALSRLRETSADIETVVELIETVASQTKLLSLNATIEAARAGELGKGFGVVATEVKNLAAETEIATEKISQRVGAIAAHSGQVRETIDRIRVAVEGLIEVQDAIGTSVDHQLQTMHEIEERATDTRTATDLVVHATNDAMATATANTSRASASAAASDELRKIVADLEVLTGR